MKRNAVMWTAATFATIMFTGSMALSANPATLLSTPENQGNVSYITGGVGEDEAAALKRAAAGYPLELQFVQRAAPRDEFLADVKVKIRDRSRNVLLDVVSSGPFLLAKLPSGTYQIEADHDGVVKRQSVAIRAGERKRAVFVWATADGTKQPTLNNAIGSSSYQ